MDEKQLEGLKKNRSELIKNSRLKLYESDVYEINVIDSSQVDYFDAIPKVNMLEEYFEFLEPNFQHYENEVDGINEDSDSVDSNHPENSNNTYPDTPVSSEDESNSGESLSEENNEQKDFSVDEKKNQNIRKLFYLCNDKSKKNTKEPVFEVLDLATLEKSMNSHLRK